MAKTSNFRVSAKVLVNGTVVPATRWSVEVNAYSISSAIDATLASASAKGFAKLPDFGQLMQTVRPMPIAIKLAYSSGSSGGSAIPLESGYVDECTRDYSGRSIDFVGRGAASLFQDVQITAPLLRNARGSDIIAKIFANRGIPLTVVQPSPQYSGRTADTQTFDQTMRGRTEWDVSQAIAVADGFRLTVHNGKGAYGPYSSGNDPVLDYEWGVAKNGAGIVDLNIKHSPRRSHNIKVIARSYLPKSGRSISKTYGAASASDGETFQIAVKSGLTSNLVQQAAQNAWNDIAKREFLVTMVLVPDETFVQTVSQYGANFSINLGGASLWASQRLTYEVRQVRFEYAPNGGALPLLAHIVAGNINPIQDGAFLS